MPPSGDDGVTTFVLMSDSGGSTEAVFSMSKDGKSVNGDLNLADGRSFFFESGFDTDNDFEVMVEVDEEFKDGKVDAIRVNSGGDGFSDRDIKLTEM